MRALWAQLWAICRMRQGPQDLPSSPAVLLLVLLLDGLISFLLQRYAEAYALTTIVGLVGLALALDALVLLALLHFKQAQAWWQQGLIAIYGSDVLLSLLAAPLVLASVQWAQSSLLPALAVLQMLLVGWGLAVRGFIYFRLLRLGIFQANMLSFTLFLLTVFLSVKLFPELMLQVSP